MCCIITASCQLANYMPEIHQPPSIPHQSGQPERLSGFKRGLTVLGMSSLTLTSIASGAVIGARIPAEVEFAPGLRADVSIQPDDAATIAINPLGSIHLPAVYQDIPLIGRVSPKLSFNKEIGVPIAGESTEQFKDYGGLARNYETSIVEPSKQAITKNALEGAGLAAAGNLAYIYHRRKRREKLHEVHARLADARSKAASHPSGNDIVEMIDQAERRIPDTRHPATYYASRLRWAAGFLGCALLASCATDAIPVSKIMRSEPAVSVPLDGRLARTFRLLKDASVSGIGGQGINAAIEKVSKEAKRVDGFWKGARENYQIAYERFKNEGGMEYLADSDLVPIFSVADVHCNQAYSQKLYGNLVRDFAASVVLVAGDTYTTVNALPYEAICLKNMLDQTTPDKQNGRAVVTVKHPGNHDPRERPNNLVRQQAKDETGEVFDQLVWLDKSIDYQAVVHAVPVIAVPDPMRSGINGTKPETSHEQHELLGSQGRTLSETACAFLSETGKPAVVVGHRPESVRETIFKGCASDVLSGHTHQTTAPTLYEAENGRTVQERTLGSASGAPIDSKGDIGITQYAVPRTPAVASVLLYSKSRGHVIGWIDITVTPEGFVRIERKRRPVQSVSVQTSPLFEAFRTPAGNTGFAY